MKCDRCREQLPVGDGIDHQGQTLCLACYIQGAASSRASARFRCLNLAGWEAEQAVKVSITNTEFLIAQV